MITITPQGQVYLCKTPLENDYKNQLTFANANSQLTYFNSTIQKTFDNYTYIKKDNVIKVGCNIDEIIDCNYLFYRNTGFTNKIYYCFITNMVYINENCTAITFETDCFQTWLFQLQPKMCFVEREHVNDDSIGLHTIPENVETGEYKAQTNDYFTSFKGDYVIIMGSTIDPSIDSEGKLIGGNNGGGVYGGVKTAYAYYSFLPTTNTLTNILKAFEDAGKSSAIGCLFMLPRTFITADSSINLDNYLIPNNQNSMNYLWNLNRPSSIDGYTPKNNKLYTYPYCYLYVSNNNGGNAIYHYEKFSDNISFMAHGIVTPSGSSHLYPRNYNGIENNYSEMLSGAKYPICGFQSDMYINWLRQNGLNIATSLITSTMQTISGVAMLGGGATAMAGAGNIGSGLLGIASTLSEIYKHSLMPPQAEGNINTGDVNYANGLNTYFANMMTIKQEYAKVIDSYFSMFGYKVNEVKIPNLYGRANWNYVKTIDCNFEGNIPQVDLNIIKTMFNKGVTLWHSPSTMYNYDANNDII